MRSLGCSVAAKRPLARAPPGKLSWDETVVDLCNIEFRQVGDGYLFGGDIFQTIEGCGSNPTAMQDAFYELGLPEMACLTVTSGGVDHGFCAPLA